MSTIEDATTAIDPQTAAGYQAKFTVLFAQLRTDPSALEAFLADPEPLLEENGIPLVAVPPAASTAPQPAGAGLRSASGDSYQMTASVAWWGVNLVMNESLTQAVISGAIASGPLASLVAASFAATGLVTGPISTLVGVAFASAFALKIAEIRLLDSGNGVYWPISWPQWMAVSVATAGGPPVVLSAILAFIHPLPN